MYGTRRPTADPDRLVIPKKGGGMTNKELEGLKKVGAE